MNKVVVCTVVEGHHFEGLPALLNSLHLCGFRGHIVVGYRGLIPGWLSHQLESRPLLGSVGFEIAGLTVSMFELSDLTIPLPMLKPKLMLTCLEVSPFDGVLYLDSDIVSHANWEFLENWVSNGVLIAQDRSYPIVPKGHPWRRAWVDLIESSGGSFSDRSDYCISACVGVPSIHRTLIETWWKLSEVYVSRVDREIVFQKGDRLQDPFFGTDQDLLNAALMCVDCDFTPADPDLLGFRGSTTFFSHPVGEKPWRKNMWLEWLLRGRVPDAYDSHYYASLGAPIRYKGRHLYWSSKVIRFLGRFYKV